MPAGKPDTVYCPINGRACVRSCALYSTDIDGCMIIKIACALEQIAINLNSINNSIEE
jgi:hypothetical protein